MNRIAMGILVLALMSCGLPVFANCGWCGTDTAKSPASASNEADMPENSPEMPLDEKIGAGTSARLAAQGPVGYDDNTGMMNVVPSDFEGDIED